MDDKKHNTVLAAWLVAAICALMILGIVGVPLVTGARLEWGAGGLLFVPFFFFLPIAFFKVAKEVRQLREENRTLRERLDAASGASHRPDSTRQS